MAETTDMAGQEGGEELAQVSASVIWEQCLKLEKCIRVFGKKYCVGVKACLRLISNNGRIILQVEAAGKQFNFNLTNACHTIYTIGIGYIQICITPRGGNSVRLQARACIRVGPIRDCWDIWGVDIKWLTAAEFRALDLRTLGMGDLAAQDLGEFVGVDDEFLPVAEERPCKCGDE